MTADAREFLTELFLSAVAGAAPGPATARAVSGLGLASSDRVHVIAVGKAAGAMSSAASDALLAQGLRIASGVVVLHDGSLPSAEGLSRVVGQHPLPGAESQAAGDAVGGIVAGVADGDVVLVLLSGGASSLVAAPVAGVEPGELRALHASLLPLGLPIGELNALRKRWSRWGAGRLAAALQHARVECLAVSDVPGDAVGDIGSGPCVGDEWSANALLALLARRDIAARVPASFVTFLERTAAGEIPETPKPGDRALAHARTRVVAGNRDALDAAAARSEELGVRCHVMPEPISGDARAAGKRIALHLLKAARVQGEPSCVIWGGESTVALPDAAPAGGRAQELALSAARTLHSSRPSVPVTLLSAGTDGRDGTTSAAGAVIDAGSWKVLQELNAVPERALVRHEAHAALAAADALLVTGPTGTNVMDVAIGLVGALPGS